ncbi:MAG TPA: ATP-binding protein, partial [Erythrobacter sp.]|nr:ATP-binding protein [Erythrobacter sp.]
GLNAYPLPFLCIPPLIWAAFRFGQREVATAVALFSAIATSATVAGSGPFVMASDNESLLVLQAFMATIAALTLPVAALVWERKAIEQERSLLLSREHAARAEAEAASHAKDEFIAMLSHELRNPLAAIASAGQVLQSQAADGAFAARAIDIVNRQAAHLGRLIEDLLDVARVTSGKIVLAREPIDMAGAVQRCLAVLHSGGRLADHRVTVDCTPAWVSADPARLNQVIDNLLLNAIKYTPTDGQIDVHTAQHGDEAVLRVSDNGIGIAADLLPRIFDLFVQGPRSLDRPQGGLGVGLTLTDRLVRAHGGALEVSSEGLGKGATFTVRLPLAKPATVRPSSPAQSGPARRILIIEDDADGREALRMHLVLAGHDVYEAANGQEGLQAAARLKPEIVLLDIGLPGVDGYQVAQQLKAAQGSPRVIAVTGYGQPEDRVRASEAGIDQHLVKPVDAAELARLLA